MFFNDKSFSEKDKTFNFIFTKIKILTKLKMLEWELISNKNIFKILKTKNKISIDSNEYFIFIYYDESFDLVFKISENFNTRSLFYFILFYFIL